MVSLSPDEPHLLNLQQIDDEIEALTPEILETITEIRCGFVPSANRFIAFLARCPSLTTLWCGTVISCGSQNPIPSSCVPQLKRFTGPLELAGALVPGRPLEEVSAFSLSGGQSQNLAEIARLIAQGTKQLRHLQIGVLDWQDGCIEEIASLFPHLKCLIVFVHVLPKDWLRDHIIEILSRLPALDSIGVYGVEMEGPPPEEELEVQRQILESVRTAYPRLVHVRYKRDIRWSSDREGHWTATYHDKHKRKLTCISPLDYLEPEVTCPRTSPLPEEPQYPNMPPEILIQIVSQIQSTREPWTDPRAVPPNQSPAQSTLRSLSLASQTLRSLAQPALFHHIHLCGTVAECHFRARKLLRMIINRPESASWIKVLRLGWQWGINLSAQDLKLTQPHAYGQRPLIDIVTDLFVRLTHLQVLRANAIRITPQIYRQIYGLPTLRSVDCYQHWVADDPTDDEFFPTEDLRIENLDIKTYTHVGPLDPATAKLARSPRLRTLATPLFLFDTYPPTAYSSLHELTITSTEGSNTDQFIKALAACPNLRSLRIDGPYPTRFVPSGDLVIPGDVVPLLERIDLPFKMVKAFVPGRPVESIRMKPSSPATPIAPWSQENWSPLIMGSTVVTELAFCGCQWVPEAMDTIFEFFPGLESLEAHFVGDQSIVSVSLSWIQTSLLDEVRRFKNIQVLHHIVDIILVGVDTRLKPDNDWKRKELAVLETALELRPTLKEVATRANRLWRLNSNRIWETDGPEPIPFWTEDGGVFAYYL